MSSDVRSIEEAFVVISPAKDAFIESRDENLYARLDSTYGSFAGHELVAAHSFDCDWGVWEMHPHGDEIVLLLSGEITFILKMQNDIKEVRLNEVGTYAVVPRGVWHTAKTEVSSKVLFITPGEGTLNQAEPG